MRSWLLAFACNQAFVVNSLVCCSEKYELVGKLLKPGEEARSFSGESSEDSDGSAELVENPDKKED